MLVIENIKVFDVGEGQQSDYPSIMMFLFDEDKRKVISNRESRHGRSNNFHFFNSLI